MRSFTSGKPPKALVSKGLRERLTRFTGQHHTENFHILGRSREKEIPLQELNPMPELPDIIYVAAKLKAELEGKKITEVTVRQPLVLRNVIDRPSSEVLIGAVLRKVWYRGPFFVFQMDEAAELIVNLMLAGRFQYQRRGEKAMGYLCLSLGSEDGSRLNLCDEQKMAKAYLVPCGDHAGVPGFEHQGIDIMSPAFTGEAFREIAKRHTRKQVRVMINDHTILSSIGNAYADEILFEAGIHPKTLVAKLKADEVERLHGAIGSVMRWGIEEVQKAGQPVEVKVREHMKVRNRHGQPCPRCGATIRREGVRGYDVFFCPKCQPATRKQFIDWSRAGSEKG